MQACAVPTRCCHWPWAAGAAGLLVCLFGSQAADAAGRGSSIAAEPIFLAQIVTLILVGRLLGEAMNRIGQPSVMGMLLAGMLLGPSLLGAFSPQLQHAIFP